MKRTTIITTVIGSILLSACAATPEPGSPAWTAEQAKHKEEARLQSVKTAIAETPSWFNDPPNDENSVYASGTSVSSDLQFAIDKAVLSSKRALADRVNSRLSGKMKDFLTESGAGENAQLYSEAERVTSNLITEVNLSGYAVTERKVIASGSEYRAYVLIQYPLGSANRLLVEQTKKNALLEGQLKASKAYQELEEDIKASRKTSGSTEDKDDDSAQKTQ